MIIKCKMCGGDILFNPGDTCGQCDHCGCTTTFPKLPDEQRTNLFNRANHFRRQCEFDKAMAAYEHILEEDETDAEAHWGIVLSKFGIEYVEDPVTHERIPTCHRAQVLSILSDEDYQNALKYAPDTSSREIYEKEAKRIAEIQKGILAISSQEKPYDVFICYKETDDSGSRTKDSTLAQEIYYQLTNEGYKVFFSRITLEDKLGQEYEPYIFAALNSARVMLVIGTKPEYFSAVWIKNEWNRYLALMKNDCTRVLIPCYRDMDPYDLPDELSSLQSQDMSKIGFIQDLIRGVRKVLDSKKPEEAKAAAPVQAVSTGANIENLMKRARLFMEDGDFNSANEYLDKVLDEDAEYAPAYAGKVCITLGFSKEADLGNATFLFSDHPDWKKALRFATPEQKAAYEGYEAQVKDRMPQQIQDYTYDCAMELAVVPGANLNILNHEIEAYRASCLTYKENRANSGRRRNSAENEKLFDNAVKTNEPGDVTEPALKDAADLFKSIRNEKADRKAEQALALAEQARQKKIYQHAAHILANRLSNPSELEKAARAFMTVPEYKDAKTQAQKCKDNAESIRNSLYNHVIEKMQQAGSKSRKWEEVKKALGNHELDAYRDIDQLRQQAAGQYEECLAAEREEERQEAEIKAAKKKRFKLLSVICAIVMISVCFIVFLVIIPDSKYKHAEQLRANGRYEEAVAAFAELGSFRDAEAQINETYKEAKYQQAKPLAAVTGTWNLSGAEGGSAADEFASAMIMVKQMGGSVSIILNEDKTASINLSLMGNEQSQPFTYEVQNNTMTWAIESSPVEFSYTVSGDTLTLEKGDIKLTLTK